MMGIGIRSKGLLKRLRKVECPHLTYGDAEFPVFVRKARGTRVWDADGKRYLDLTSFFGVAGLGAGDASADRRWLACDGGCSSA